MALEIVMRNGREYVKLPTKYITVCGKKIYSSSIGKNCFFIYIPIEKFDASRYRG